MAQNRRSQQRDIAPKPPRSSEQPRDDEAYQLQISASYSGPLPHPQVLAQYNQIVPDAAERMIVLAEKQSEHRQYIEKQAVEGELRQQLLGVISAFVITLFFLGVAGFLVYKGHDAAGASIGIVDIAALAGVFIYGTRSRRQEREHRARLQTGRDTTPQ